jgi:hypothetical protein
MEVVGAYDPTNGGSGSSGDFAGGSDGTSNQSQLLAQVQSLSGAQIQQFFADNQISSTDQQMYLTNGKLNQNAADLFWYTSLNQQERQQVQEQMVSTGWLSPTSANGEVSSTSTDAFEKLMGSVSLQGTDARTWLTQNATGTSAISNQISENLTKADENATQPIIATEENPTTLSATLTSAFENALGYSPDQAQIQSFINQVQGQDTTYAEAPRAEAQAQISQAKSENAALEQLGPDGIDSVIQAYQAAVSGTKLPGAGTTQGPNLSTAQSIAPVMAQPGTARIPVTSPTATQLPPGMTAPSGPGVTNSMQYVPEGLIGTAINKVTTGSSAAQVRQDVTTIHGEKTTDKKVATGGTQIAPTHFNPGQTGGLGGTYALNAADWAEAQKLYPAAKKFTSAGLAPQSIQLGAFSSLLSNAYDNNGGSWSQAISAIASGTPLGQAKGANLSAFGDQVASQVNDQITALQNQVNNDTVTTKVSAPDATAEANLAAKQSDPTGYYAAQSASWGEELNKMLSGTSSMYDQTSADTFTGPVGAEAATASATAPTTVGAGAP